MDFHNLVVGVEQVDPIRIPELVINVEDAMRVAIARSFARDAVTSSITMRRNSHWPQEGLGHPNGM